LENFKESGYPRGSEWRRWDLHIHTPESKLGASFPGTDWASYVTALNKAAYERSIAVVGLTDYMSIDGYEKALASRENLRSIKLLIPNIEFRALPATKDGKALNIHLLIDPTSPDHVERIKRALRQLRTPYDGETYGCIREDLIEYARRQKPGLDDEEAAYKFGIEQFKPSYQEIAKWLKNERWLRENSLIGIANGKDGISGLPPDGFSATRDELLKMAHFVFSGNPNDREYYLGKKAGVSPDEIFRQYGSLKPCLHGSDAHEVDKFFEPDEGRYCWIKADPTFEGLRQVLWEPDIRVVIGASKPEQSDRSRVISELRISPNNSWFAQSTIPLNPGLVAIIGEKGSGKTAIADLIAFTSGAYNEKGSQSSFISKGRLHLGGITTELIWEAGAPCNATLTMTPYVAQRPLVRYLSQDFVEQLCSNDHEGRELQEAIEEVVFAHLDDSSQEGFSSFAELRASREHASQSNRDSIRGELASTNREIERLTQAITQIPNKSALKQHAELRVAELRKQLPEVEALADKTILDRLEKEKVEASGVEKLVAECSRQKRGLDDIAKSYALIKERTNKQIEELVESAALFPQMAPVLALGLYPTWTAWIEPSLQNLAVDIEQKIDGLKGPTEGADPAGASLASRAIRIKLLQESLSKDEQNRKRLLDLQKQVAEQEAAVARIDIEILELESKAKRQLLSKQEERDNLYVRYFSALEADGTGLRDLYKPMKTHLSLHGGKMQFELSAGYRVDTKAWLDKAARFYDGRKTGSNTRRDEVEKYAHDTLAPAWKTGDIDKIELAFKGFYELMAPTTFTSLYGTPSLTMLDLFDWMYSTDHVEISYKILYANTELEYLSPGTRGIALLVLYLLMDEDDRRPLIIDQPEGNLDNSSIYAQLVPYIRAAKEKRQIILVTHNPNLVVATDADQVIVANAIRPTTQSYPQITYRSGSIEHAHTDQEPGIRQAVCTLLEGGKAAFKDREGRYSM
jgi:hypothetical protein